MPAICPYCPITDPGTEVVFERELVLFLRNPRYQGALKHSRIIIPKAHRATAFELTEEEWLATYGLLREVSEAAQAAFERDVEWLHVDFVAELEPLYSKAGYLPTQAGLFALRKGAAQ